jgi:hypothetical protein
MLSAQRVPCGASTRGLGLFQHVARFRGRRTAELAQCGVACEYQRCDCAARNDAQPVSPRKCDHRGAYAVAAAGAGAGGWRAPSESSAALTARSNNGTGSTTSETSPALIS